MGLKFLGLQRLATQLLRILWVESKSLMNVVNEI